MGDTRALFATEYMSFLSSGWLEAVFGSNGAAEEPTLDKLASTMKVGECTADVLFPALSEAFSRSPIGVNVEAIGDSLGVSWKLLVTNFVVEAVVNGSGLPNTVEVCTLAVGLDLTGTGRRVNTGGTNFLLVSHESEFCSI